MSPISAVTGRELPAIMVSTYSAESVGTEASGLTGFSTPASAAWATANRAVYVPLYLAVPCVVLKLWWGNGTAVAGNVDVGIYRYSDLGLVVSTGSTAQATANVLQSVDIADTPLARGIYYLALAASSTSATFWMNSSATLQPFKILGMAIQETALPLPSTAVPAAITGTGQLPQFGLALRTTI